MGTFLYSNVHITCCFCCIFPLLECVNANQKLLFFFSHFRLLDLDPLLHLSLRCLPTRQRDDCSRKGRIHHRRCCCQLNRVTNNVFPPPSCNFHKVRPGACAWFNLSLDDLAEFLWCYISMGFYELIPASTL